ncbi:MAG: hypothetical protein WCL33_06980 [Planctomycetota bacterium]
MTETPPTFTAAIQTTHWPKTLGIISIVFGSFGAMAGFCGVIGSAALGPISEAMAKFMPAGKNGPSPADTFEALQKMQGWMIANSVLTTLVAILLIVGGAKLMKRQAQSQMMLLSWAALKILLAVIASVLGYFSLQDQMAAVEKSGTATPAMSQSATQLMGLFSMGFGFLWAIAGAVFIIIWFKREKIRSEVSSWM